MILILSFFFGFRVVLVVGAGSGSGGGGGGDGGAAVTAYGIITGNNLNRRMRGNRSHELHILERCGHKDNEKDNITRSPKANSSRTFNSKHY